MVVCCENFSETIWVRSRDGLRWFCEWWRGGEGFPRSQLSTFCTGRGLPWNLRSSDPTVQSALVENQGAKPVPQEPAACGRDTCQETNDEYYYGYFHSQCSEAQRKYFLENMGYILPTGLIDQPKTLQEKVAGISPLVAIRPYCSVMCIIVYVVCALTHTNCREKKNE